MKISYLLECCSSAIYIQLYNVKICNIAIRAVAVPIAKHMKHIVNRAKKHS
jgi:hypothetical protein